jgi:hypothetical protein
MGKEKLGKGIIKVSCLERQESLRGQNRFCLEGGRGWEGDTNNVYTCK